jgi:hypothetical protein
MKIKRNFLKRNLSMYKRRNEKKEEKDFFFLSLAFFSIKEEKCEERTQNETSDETVPPIHRPRTCAD